jgi:hypothetical protein
VIISEKISLIFVAFAEVIQRRSKTSFALRCRAQVISQTQAKNDFLNNVLLKFQFKKVLFFQKDT